MQKQTLTHLIFFTLLFYTLGCTSKEEPEPIPDPTSFACLLLKEQVTFATPGESQTRDYHFEEGYLTHVTDVYQGQRPSTTTVIFDYNALGDVASTTLLDVQGRPLEGFEFIHDLNGLPKQMNWYNKRQNPGSPVLSHYATREYTFNNNMQLINVKNWLVTTSPRMLLNDYTFTYDAKGNLSQLQEYRVITLQESNPANFTDIVINQKFTYDDKINPYRENLYVHYLPTNGIFIPGISPNNIVTTTSVSTLEGNKKGPGPNFNASTYNFTRTNTYTYTDQGRPQTVTSSTGSVRTFTYRCELSKTM